MNIEINSDPRFDWHPWFAWHPVHAWEEACSWHPRALIRRRVWLRTVERRLRRVRWDLDDWEYRV